MHMKKKSLKRSHGIVVRFKAGTRNNIKQQSSTPDPDPLKAPSISSPTSSTNNSSRNALIGPLQKNPTVTSIVPYPFSKYVYRLSHLHILPPFPPFHPYLPYTSVFTQFIIRSFT